MGLGICKQHGRPLEAMAPFWYKTSVGIPQTQGPSAEVIAIPAVDEGVAAWADQMPRQRPAQQVDDSRASLAGG